MDKRNLYTGFNVVVMIGEGDEGSLVAGFHEVSGLSLDGNAGSNVRLVLKRGLIRVDQLEAWCTAIQKRRPDRYAITIVVRDKQREIRLKHAQLIKVDAPLLKATANDVSIEELELTGEGVTISPIARAKD